MFEETQDSGESNKALDYRPSSYDPAKLLKKRPRPMPLRTMLRIDLLADKEMFHGVIERLPPNGKTGNARFDNHNAVLWVLERDAATGRNHFQQLSEGALWKVLNTVLKDDFKIMIFGKLLPAPSE